jgi:putative ABC transport system substrate-binding protein
MMAVAGAAMWPLTARAQQPAMPVIGYLSGRSLATDAHLVAAFRQGLHENGYVEGQNVAVEFRWAEGQLFDRLTAQAADLVARRVSVVFACALDVRIQQVRAAISEIPVVFATASDPVELGLVGNFNRPGGNSTAVTVISVALWPKRLQLLHAWWRRPRTSHCWSIRMIRGAHRPGATSMPPPARSV